MRERIKEIDYVRALATLGVIIIHVTSGYVSKIEAGYILNQIVRFSVPVFIILSGYSVNLSSYNRDEGYITFLKKRLSKIIIPYLLWSFIYFYYYRTNVENLFTTDYLIVFTKNIIMGTNGPHLYFIVIILQMYFLYPLIKRLIEKNYSKVLLTVSFILTAYFQIGMYLRGQGYRLLPEVFLKYYYVLLPTWIFYFILGIYVSKNYLILRKKIEERWLLSSILWILSLGLLILDSKITKTPGSSMKPTIIIYSAVSFFLLCSLSLRLKNIKLTNTLEFISNNSFLIYLSHVLVLAILQRNFPNHIIGVLGMIKLLISTTILTFLLCYLIDKIPFSIHIGGTKKNLFLNHK